MWSNATRRSPSHPTPGPNRPGSTASISEDPDQASAVQHQHSNWCISSTHRCDLNVVVSVHSCWRSAGSWQRRSVSPCPDFSEDDRCERSGDNDPDCCKDPYVRKTIELSIDFAGAIATTLPPSANREKSQHPKADASDADPELLAVVSSTPGNNCHRDGQEGQHQPCNVCSRPGRENIGEVITNDIGGQHRSQSNDQKCEQRNGTPSFRQ
jgi:hypothetical protein